MVGNVRWIPATSELCSIFIDPDHVRQGIASELKKKAYGDVISHGVEKLWLYVSLTAIQYYKAEGWETLEQTMRGALACVRMEKSMAS